MSLQRSLERRTERYARALARRPGFFKTTVMPIGLALADPDLGPGIARWLGDARGSGGAATECLCCGAPWAVPAGVVIVDPLRRSRKALTSGLCHSCLESEGLQGRVASAMEKGLGLDPAGWRRVTAAGHA